MKKYFGISSMIMFFIYSNCFATSIRSGQTADYVSVLDEGLFPIQSSIGKNSAICAGKSIIFEIPNNTALFVAEDAKFEAKEIITFIFNGLDYILPSNTFKGFAICNNNKLIISKQHQE